MEIWTIYLVMEMDRFSPGPDSTYPPAQPHFINDLLQALFTMAAQPFHAPAASPPPFHLAFFDCLVLPAFKDLPVSSIICFNWVYRLLNVQTECIDWVHRESVGTESMDWVDGLSGWTESMDSVYELSNYINWELTESWYKMGTKFEYW